MDTQTPFVVISAEKRELSPRENFERTSELRDILTEDGHSFIPSLGIWQGQEEESFVVFLPRPGRPGRALEENLEDILALALFDLQQDAVLYVDANRQAYITNVAIEGADTFAVRHVGAWKNIADTPLTEVEARSQGLTRTQDGQIYVIV